MFNIVTTMVLLPFGNWMVKAAIRILPDSKKEKELLPHLKYITQSDPSSDRHIGSSAIHLTQLEMELGRMLSMAQENVRAAFHAVLQRDDSSAGKVTEREDYLDYLNKEISQFISRIIVLETNEGPLRYPAPILKSAVILSGLATCPEHLRLHQPDEGKRYSFF